MARVCQQSERALGRAFVLGVFPPGATGLRRDSATWLRYSSNSCSQKRLQCRKTLSNQEYWSSYK
ncbi:hypothetical protein DM47_3284 [Burkholderia mallei]|nr:hypothetical protein DM47_3284 [Burkholderia mallei]